MAVDVSRMAVIGDSITAGYGVALAEAWTYRMEARQAGGNLMPLGIYGATGRRWLQQHLHALDILPRWRPTTVMLALGANEYHIARPAGEYADHLRQLTDYVRTLTPAARIVYLHYYRITAAIDPAGCDAIPGDPAGCIHASPPDSWATYGQAMAQMAAQQGATYVDIAGTRDWGPYQFDQAHLTAEGHRLFEADLRAALQAA